MSTSWHARIRNQLLDVLDPEAAKYHEVHPTEALTLSLEEQPSATLVALTELAQLGDTSAVGMHTLPEGLKPLLSLCRCSRRRCVHACMHDRAQVALTPKLALYSPFSIPLPLIYSQLRTLALVLLRRYIVRTAPDHEATQ